MNALKLIALTLVDLAKQLWSLLQALGVAIRGSRGQAGRDAVELERLDRIRHPSKYLEKVNVAPPK
ncbi:MAG TPA: hypothetical protein VK327_10040 [Candidatus Paceibacterota bacterium]|nr:hypothetical protein [Candidatus Paceibacterota bacterium]